MNFVIHRGSDEIGGGCIQLFSDNSSILLDLGKPLSKKSKSIDTSSLQPDAVLISHPHQDHYGLIDAIDADVPVYIGEVGKKLIDANRMIIGEPLHLNNFKYFRNKQPFKVGNFTIIPHLVDHSAVDAYGFLIEADGKRIFYSGDFRAHGRKSVLFNRVISNPPKDIDLLFMEGTMIHRKNSEFPSESHVEQKIFETISNQENISFLIASSQNIDRIVSAFRACKRAGKTLVIDIYTAWVLEQLKFVSNNIPAMEWDLISVYTTFNQYKKVKENYEFFGNFRTRLFKHRIEKEEIHTSPSDYLFFGKMSHYNIIELYKSVRRVNVIYSQWLGYLSAQEYNYYGAEEIAAYRNDPDINFVYAHTSGHATIEDLKRFADALKPKALIPVHTEDKKAFKDLYQPTLIQNDGERFDMDEFY